MSDQAEIERRIEKMRMEIPAGAYGACSEWATNTAFLLTQLDAARADTARLDWLTTADYFDFEDCYRATREYIDSAMMATTGETPPGSEGETG